MATNNSDTSFLDNAKEYAGNVASNAYTQTKNEFSRVNQNSKDRDWIVERENKLNNLTSSQKEQLKYISNADDAMKFVETATSGDSEGAEKLYNQALKSQGGAILSFAGDVATTALGGAAGKAAIKAAPKLFKGAAEVIGENIPSLKKYGNIFKSSADRADEALAAERTARAAAREQRAQESIQRAQTEQQQARTARNSTQNSETPFRSNTTRATEATQETVTPRPQQSIFGKVADWTKDKIVQGADWTKDKIVQGADWAGGKVVEGAKSVGSGIASLGKTTLKGASLGAAIGIPAGEYYDSLSDEEKALWQEKAQKGVDWVDNAIDHPGEAWEDVKKGAGDLLGDAGSAALGAIVGKGSNPFKGISAGMGSLFAGGGSIGSTLNSMPSGGDSGITGEGHFGGDNIQGTSAIEVLNKIYNILAKTYDTVNTISRDVSTLTRSQSQQNAANDINSVNMQARQNEMGMATATPMYGGGGSSIQSGGGEEDNKEGGFWSKIFSAGKKINPKAAGAAAASLANPGKKVGLLKKLWDTGKKVAKPAAQIGSAALGAELLKSGDSDGSDKALYAKKFFMDKGYTEEQAAGIVGNLQGESGNFNKDVISGERRGDGGKAVGIAQWHPDRQAKFKEIMHKDLIGSSYEDQLEFVNWELNNSHKKAGDDLRKQTTAAGAAKSVEGKYEITAKSMHGGHSPERVKNAEKLMGKNLPDKKETSSAKPEINGTKLTGDTKRNPYFGQETTPFEENEEVDNSSQKENIPESMEAFRTELLEHKAKEEAAEAEYNRLKDESNDAPDHYQRFSDADYKLTNIRNSRAGILFDEKYKDSKDFIDEHDTNIHSYDNFINDPDYLKKKGLDKKQTTSMSHGEHSPKKERTAEKLISDIKTNFGQETPAVTENTTRYAPQKDMSNASPDEIREEELAQKADAATASPLSKKEQDMLAEVDNLDAQDAKLKAERDAEPSYKNYGDDKESMDKDLNRLSENYAKQDTLDKKRNDIIGTPEYMEAVKKQKGQSGQSQAPARQQQPQQAPAPAAAGVGKSIPSVRNDDPTIKMMEEGSMWSTQGA